MSFLKSDVIIERLCVMWENIISSYQNAPRDVCTRPRLCRTPRWFYVFAKSGKLYIESGRHHADCSKINHARMLEETKCAQIFELYKLRNSGEKVSDRARKVTVNQVYWYGIFADLGY